MSKQERRNATDDEHLRLLLALSLPANANCIDVGAHVGEILDAIVLAAPEGRHLAFEPLPDLAAALRVRHPSVEVHQAAVAATAGSRTFRRVVSAPARSGFHEGGYNSDATEDLTVDVLVLDEVVPAERVVHFLKVDVEGAELEVLHGAHRILTRDRPAVAFEHGGPPATSRAIHDLLCTQNGLRIFDLDGVGPMNTQQFLRVLASGARWNFIAHR